MRILLSSVLLAACGPLYPQQQAQPQQQAPQPAQPQAGPPGMPADPYDPNNASAPPLAAQGALTQDPGFGRPVMAQPDPQPAPMQAPPQPQPPLSSDTQALVDAHNAARARHCAAPLTWSPALAQAAARWANNLRDRNCAFEHSPNNKYGENLAGGTSGYLDSNAVVAMWYGEVKKYDFANPGFSMETGHFTQVVWRGTTQVGCARSTCGSQNQDIWVCEYDPAGNWEGQYKQNVLPTGCR